MMGIPSQTFNVKPKLICNTFTAVRNRICDCVYVGCNGRLHIHHSNINYAKPIHGENANDLLQFSPNEFSCFSHNCLLHSTKQATPTVASKFPDHSPCPHGLSCHVC